MIDARNSDTSAFETIGAAAEELSRSDSEIVARAGTRIHAIVLDLLLEIAPADYQGSWQKVN